MLPSRGVGSQTSVGYQPRNGNYFPQVNGYTVSLAKMGNCPSQNGKWTNQNHFHYTMNIATGWQGSIVPGSSEILDPNFSWRWPPSWKVGTYKNPSNYCMFTEPDVQGDLADGTPAGWYSTNFANLNQVAKHMSFLPHFKTGNAVYLDGRVNNLSLQFYQSWVALPTAQRNVPFLIMP
jgi:hypothetical protein